MSCEIKSFTDEAVSKLAEYLSEHIQDSKQSLEKQVAYFRSPQFKKDFGDYAKAREAGYEGAYAEMLNRIDENGEPKLQFNETAQKHYFLDKNNHIVYYPLVDRGLRGFLKYEQIESLASTFALKYFRGSGLDFNNIDFEGGEKLPDLGRFIEHEIAKKEIEFRDSDDVKLKMKVPVIQKLNEHIAELEEQTQLFFTKLGIAFNQDETSEDALVIEEAGKDPAFGLMSAERNSKDACSTNIKLKLSLLPSKKIDPLWNEPGFEKFSEVYSTLLDILTMNTDLPGEDIWELYKSTMANVSSKKPFLKLLGDYVTSPDFTEEDVNEFVQAFRLNKNQHLQTDVKSKNVPVVDEQGNTTGTTTMLTHNTYSVSDAGAKTELVKENWFTGFKEKFLKEDGKPIKKENEQLTKIHKSFIALQDMYNKIVESPTYKPEDLDVVVNQTIKGLNAFGMNITLDGISYYLDNGGKNVSIAYRDKQLKKLIEQSIYAVKNINEDFKKGTYYNVNKLFASTEMQKMARSEAFFIADGSDSSVNQGGKKMYVYSYPSYISNKVRQWKKDAAEALAELRANPEMQSRPMILDQLLDSSQYVKGSHTLAYLTGRVKMDGSKENYYGETERERELARLDKADERLEGFDIGLFNQVSLDSNFAATSDLAMADYVKDDVQKVLRNTYTRTITQADKGSEFNIKTGIKIDGATFRGDENALVTKSAKHIFSKYIASEFNRMIEAHRQVDASKDGMDLSVHYHYKYKQREEGESEVDYQKKLFARNGNAFNMHYFERLTPGSKNLTAQEQAIHDLIYDENRRPIQGAMDNTETKQLIEAYVEEELLKNVDRTVEGLIANDVLEMTEDGISIKNIDSMLTHEYNHKFKEFGPSAAATALAMDYYINSTSRLIEYSKMFTGDVAYYKNPVDFKKRVPATYTDGLQLRVKPDQEMFRVATIENVNRSSPYLDELRKSYEQDGHKFGLEEVAENYKKINSTDAQAWITPDRWKFLLQGLGKWTKGKDSYESVYNKMMSETPVEYTQKELKLAAQPMKGVYFGRTSDGKPVFLKYSQAVLSKQLVQGSDLERIYNKMVDPSNTVDELITLDGVKVGSLTPTKVHNIDGQVIDEKDIAFNVMELQNRDWKLQQDLPTKTYKDTDVGSQIQKNIFAGLIHLRQDENFKLDGKFVSGQHVMDEIVKTVTGMTEDGLQRLKKEFKVNKDYNIENVRGFYDTLIADLEKRGGSKNVIDALKAEIALPGIPQAGSKLVNVFTSIVTDRLIKIKTNGGSFIQMSNFGVNYKEGSKQGVKWAPFIGEGQTTSEPTLTLDENGRVVVKPGGVLVSGSFIGKYVPDWNKRTPEELFGTYEGDKLITRGLLDPKIINNIIGYRIPNQGLASNDSLRIVGILPEGQGDTIVAYTGITTKTGSDFDIDKMYMMFPKYKKDENGLHYDEEDKGNRLIELYKTVLTHPEVYKKVMSPIDIPFLQDEINMILPEEKSENALMTFDPLSDIQLRYSFLGGKAGVGMEANALVDISRPGTLSLNGLYIGWGNQINKETSFDHEYSVPLSKTDLDYYVGEMAKVQGSKFNEKEFRKSINKIAIGDTLTAILNAFVDIAKDPYITKGNWVTSTTNVGNLLIRAGMHPVMTINFMAQPIIGEFVKFKQNLEGLGQTAPGDMVFAFQKHTVIQALRKADPTYENYFKLMSGLNVQYKLDRLAEEFGKKEMTQESYDSAKKELTDIRTEAKIKIFKSLKDKSLSKEEKIAKVNEISEFITGEYNKVFNPKKAIDVTKKDLQYYREQNLKDKDGNYIHRDNEFQYAILKKFESLQKTSQTLRENVIVSKLDTSGPGKNITSLYSIFNTKSNILAKENEPGALKGFATKFNNTTLSAYANSLEEVVRIVQNNPLLFPQGTAQAQDMFNEISQDVFDKAADNEKLSTELEVSYTSYLMSDFMNVGTQEKIDLITKFPKELSTFLEKNKDKYFMFKDLIVKAPKEQGHMSTIALNNRKKDIYYEKAFTDSWSDLFLDNPEMAEKLVKYSFVTTGFRMTTSQFFTYIPYNYMISKDINGFIKNATESDQAAFIDLFYRNNFDNKKYVPTINPKLEVASVGRFNENDVFKIEGITDASYYIARDIQKTIDEKAVTVRQVYRMQGYSDVRNDGTYQSPVYIKVKSATFEVNGKTIQDYSQAKSDLLYDFPKDKVDLVIAAVNNHIIRDRGGNNVQVTPREIVSEKPVPERVEAFKNTPEELWEKHSKKLLKANPEMTFEEFDNMIPAEREKLIECYG